MRAWERLFRCPAQNSATGPAMALFYLPVLEFVPTGGFTQTVFTHPDQHPLVMQPPFERLTSAAYPSMIWGLFVKVTRKRAHIRRNEREFWKPRWHTIIWFFSIPSPFELKPDKPFGTAAQTDRASGSQGPPCKRRPLTGSNRASRDKGAYAPMACLVPGSSRRREQTPFPLEPISISDRLAAQPNACGGSRRPADSLTSVTSAAAGVCRTSTDRPLSQHTKTRKDSPPGRIGNGALNPVASHRQAECARTRHPDKANVPGHGHHESGFKKKVVALHPKRVRSRIDKQGGHHQKPSVQAARPPSHMNQIGRRTGKGTG